MNILKSHYSLQRIKHLINAGNYRITASARKSAFEDFNMLEDEIIDLILTLEVSNLYKTMPSHHDPDLWQDVYHRRINDKIAYIKLQIKLDNSIIISFKEK